MSKIVFGEVDWNSTAGESGGGKTQFMRLEQGRNVVRVMGNPLQFFINWVETSEGKRKVNSPVSSPELLQRLDDAGFKRKPRWIIKVLDRNDGQFKLLEIGPQIYNGIRQLVNDPDWGKVTSYDLVITRGKPGQQPLYSVSPRPKSGLDESLKDAFMAFNDGLNLDRLIQPSDPKYVLELLGWGGSDVGDAGGDSASSEEDDFPFDFN
nr:hypothetical protein 33 [bacterium]